MDLEGGDAAQGLCGQERRSGANWPWLDKSRLRFNRAAYHGKSRAQPPKAHQSTAHTRMHTHTHTQTLDAAPDLEPQARILLMAPDGQPYTTAYHEALRAAPPSLSSPWWLEVVSSHCLGMHQVAPKGSGPLESAPKPAGYQQHFASCKHEAGPLLTTPRQQQAKCTHTHTHTPHP